MEEFAWRASRHVPSRPRESLAWELHHGLLHSLIEMQVRNQRVLSPENTG